MTLTILRHAIIVATLMAVTGPAFAQSVHIPNWPAMYLRAEADDRVLAPLTSASNELTEADAYILQRSLVYERLRTDSIGGFKAGFTDRASQKRFEIPHPGVGVLFKGGISHSKLAFERPSARTRLIEAEVGLIVGTRIALPVASVEDLKPLIKSAIAAIEMPVLTFEPTLMRGRDAIAENMGAKDVIIGGELPMNYLEAREFSVVLTRDGETLINLPDVDRTELWETALFLVNKVIENGYTIEKGHLLILGALGGAQPYRPGKYVAKIGWLGTLTFEEK